MKIFGYLIVALLVTTAMACQDARRLATKGAHRTADIVQNKDLPQILPTSLEEQIKGSWALVAVEVRGQLSEQDPEGFVKGQKTMATFDGSKVVFTISFKDAESQQDAHDYSIKDGQLILAGKSYKMVLTAESLEIHYQDKDMQVEKYKKLVSKIEPEIEAPGDF